jgi:hypothetical protein
MSGRRRRKPLRWSELAVLALLGGLVVVGLVANGRGVVDALAAAGFAVVMLLGAWGWQWTCRRAGSRPPPSGKQWVCEAAVVVALLAVLGGGVAAWWYYRSQRAGEMDGQGVPAASDREPPAKQPDDGEQPEQPPRPRPHGGEERRAA